ncbi:LacI family DNA-binding transcriptional regulator [Aliihoeflea sp. PC F10.4]
MTDRFPKIRDVAIAAGVSTATVSRSLSAPDRVSETTRASVLKAIEETGYRINHAARNLRRRQAGGIVVLVPNLANPFFSQILSGITAAMATSGYNVLIADTRPASDADHRITDYLHNNRADGLIVLDADLPADVLSISETTTRHPPIVFACEWLDSDPRPTVTIDNVEGARLAIGHLADLGHTRIGHLMGPPDNILTITRRHGARAALTERALEIREDWFFTGDFSLASGAAAADRWLALEERPSAVFCASDAMACGFIGALHQRGVSVPHDVSVVGFDDIEIAAHFVPSLTTIAQPRALIGETAARTLLSLIETSQNGDATPAISQTLPVRLVVRESAAPPEK